MPGMDGLQAARAIKADPALRHQPVIIMVTAFGREEVRDEAEQLNSTASSSNPSPSRWSWTRSSTPS